LDDDLVVGVLFNANRVFSVTYPFLRDLLKELPSIDIGLFDFLHLLNLVFLSLARDGLAVGGTVLSWVLKFALSVYRGD